MFSGRGKREREGEINEGGRQTDQILNQRAYAAEAAVGAAVQVQEFYTTNGIVERGGEINYYGDSARERSAKWE